VRKRSSRVAVASLPLLGAAARIHAVRSHGRHREWQRSSHVAVNFIHPAASFKFLGTAAAIHVSLAAAIRASLAAAAIKAWRSHGRHRVRYNAAAGSTPPLPRRYLLYSVRHRGFRVTDALFRLIYATAVIRFLRFRVFFRVFYLPKFESSLV
jgi:hypothetical protein